MRRVALLTAAVVAAAGVVPSVADAGKRRRHKPARAAAEHARPGLQGRVVGRAVAFGSWRSGGFRTAGLPAAPGAASPSAGSAPAAAATPAPSGSPATPALPPAAASSVSVRSTEFAFSLTQPSVRAGRVRIQFDNSRAEDPHSLLVLRDGDPAASFAEAAPGEVASKTVTLGAGVYTLLCPIADHAARGMSTELTVAGS